MSILPEKMNSQQYGWFGYPGAMCDRAIRADNAEMLKECVDRGYINDNSEMFCGCSVLDYCRKVAPKCASMLESLNLD